MGKRPAGFKKRKEKKGWKAAEMRPIDLSFITAGLLVINSFTGFNIHTHALLWPLMSKLSLTILCRYINLKAN